MPAFLELAFTNQQVTNQPQISVTAAKAWQVREKLGGSGEASATLRGGQFQAGLRAELGCAVGSTGGAARRPGCWSTGMEGEGQGQRDRDGGPK